MSNFREAIAEYIRAEAKPVDKYSHQPRLYEWALRVGEGQEYDDDVLYAAVWLHDLGVFVGHRPEDLEQLSRWDHIAYVREKAPALLRQFGCPEEKIPAVLSAIATHLPSGVPECPEGAILRDADLLEQLGAVGILRMVSKVGRDTRYPTLHSAVAMLRKQFSELPAHIHSERARALAAEKLHLMQEFLDAAEAETLGGPL